MTTFAELRINERFIAGSEEDGECAEGARFRKVSATTAVLWYREPIFEKKSDGTPKLIGFKLRESPVATRFRPSTPVLRLPEK